MHGAVKAVQQEEDPDQQVEGSFDAQVVHAGGYDLRLFGLYEEKHQGPGEQEDQCADRCGKSDGDQDGFLRSSADASLFLRAVILRDKGGKRVSEVLNRHIGE